MKKVRHVEIFSAGCQVCDDMITIVKQLACPSCNITVLDMNDQAVSSRARTLGIRTIPAVLVDGQPAQCCADGGPTERILRLTGIGTPLG